MKTISDRLLTGFAWFSGMATLLVVAILVFYLFGRGVTSINAALFFGDTPWMDALLGKKPVFEGIWPALVGTLMLVALSTAIAIPIGIASGIYLAQYASGRIRVLLSFLVDLLAGTPSIVMGLFGFTLILTLRRTLIPEARTGLLLAAGCLAMLVLPYVIRTTQMALDAIPEHLRLLGPSVGLSKWQNIRRVLLPLASRGILSGAILAIGRAVEDTAVILLTGVVAQAGIPRGLADKFEALPFRIYYLAAEHRNQEQLDQGFGTALVLVFITVVLFLFAMIFHRSAEKRWQLH